MICRPTEDGWFFIAQPAHAWLAGELAANWGNERFGLPSPREAVILATRLHDCGWSGWDAHPRVDEAGQPVNFIATTLDETIPIWRQAVEQVSLLDPYAAVLVSKHATTIYRRRLERHADPPARRPDVAAALTAQEAYQRDAVQCLQDHPLYGEAVHPTRLETAYRWLRVCDLLSLVLCAAILPPAGELQRAPLTEPGQFCALNYRLDGPFALTVTPWPFATSSLALSIEGRRLHSQTFSSHAALQTALEQAPWVHQPVTLRSGD